MAVLAIYQDPLVADRLALPGCHVIDLGLLPVRGEGARNKKGDSVGRA